jgi:hypothetical protein
VIDRLSRKAAAILWMALVVLLPITSMPLVVRLVHSDVVASPSILFLAALILVWFLPYIWKNGGLPRQSLPLLAFGLVAVFATALASFQEIPPYKDISSLRNSVSSIVTLGIGLSFYLVTSVYPNSQQRLQSVLRWLNWTGLVVLLWSLVQTAAWYGLGRYPEWLRTIHGWYSVGTLFRQRTTGFALEPSWLAHQLNLLFLPFWLAAVARRHSVHRLRIFGKLIFEDLLLVLGALVLWLTLSRVGLFAFLLMIAYLLVRANLWLKARLQDWVWRRWQTRTGQVRLRQQFLSWGMTLLMLAVYLGLFLGMGFALSKVDPRMADLFNFSFSEDNPLLAYANSLNFSSRLVYWEGGWNIFNDHPLLGVGLGNAGFFFPEKLGGYAWWLVEVRDLFFRSSVLLNIKSLWVRLLTETGIVGFSLFSVWFYLIWQTGRALEAQSSPIRRMVALAAQLLVIGFMIEGFSVDSFAIPYIWFSAGLITAAHYSVSSLQDGPARKGVKVE